eukprot:CAMPEP_0115105416 /NCGR_PEP_ID=MMETSP0227-20121206/35981_1 /TAXON_ID=89957 /ORGANISM="Polarella glacialis, Strain CCMP 1383" /LENGTH=102 /DNA_ID=CAMNT_0002502687 /DNA_START=139 /DNA_END=444 /DNA_ORIENTATION=-
MTLGQLMSFVMQDVMQVALVVACVFAGWTLQTTLCSHILLNVARPLAKTVEFANDDQDDDEFSKDSSPSSKSSEVFMSEEQLPAGLRLLEQYGVFGASPGAW